VAAGPPPAVPAMEPVVVQHAASAVEYMAAVEPTGVELSVPAAQAAAAAPVAEAATTVRLVSEALSGLALKLAAVKKPAAGVLTAAVEPVAVTAVVWRQCQQRPRESGQCCLTDQWQPQRSVGS
jgi:hypothetical protein